MRVPNAALFWLLAPASMALWLILVTPTGWLGIDTSAAGTGLLLVTAWFGLWMSTRIPANREASVSPGEVRQWVALAFTGAIAAFLVASADTIARAEGTSDLRGIGRTVAMLVIGWVLFSAVLRQRAHAGVQEDERDRQVQRRADRGSHTTICLLVIALALTLGLSPSDRLAWATPIVIAHLLVLALVVASLSGCIIAIWQYRRAASEDTSA
jgi:uncharacterized membrane protein